MKISKILVIVLIILVLIGGGYFLAMAEKIDLAADDILFVPKEEEKADITGIIKNNGDTTVSQLTYVFSINGKKEEGSLPVNLQAGEKFQLNLNHAYPNYYNLFYDKSAPKPFELKMTLEVDPKNELKDSDRTNNEITKTFYIQN